MVQFSLEKSPVSNPSKKLGLGRGGVTLGDGAEVGVAVGVAVTGETFEGAIVGA
jgi:hypothetical protein